MMKKVCQAIFVLFRSEKMQVFVATLLYYASLYFSTSNRSLFVLTLLYWFVVIRITKNFSLSVFLLCITTLPFPKGKAYQFILLPKENIQHWALYSITYFFPVYLTDFFLVLLGYLYLRHKIIFGVFKRTSLSKWPYLMFFFFILWVILGCLVSVFPEIGILSAVQLLRMMLLMSLPLMVYAKRTDVVYGVYSVAAAALIFESVWAIFQVIHGGPLGRDIEVYLAGSAFGIGSSENASLLRVTGTFFEPSIFGAFLLMQLGVITTFLLDVKRFIYFRSVAIGSLLLGSIALVFTGSRVLYGVWFFLVYFFFRYLLRVYPRSISRVQQYLSWRLVVISIGIMTVFVPYLYARLASLTDVFTHYGSANYRIQMIQYALRLGVSNPLLGNGINLSPYYLATEFRGEQYVFDPTYPHNLIAQLVAETGFVGTILFVFFCISLIRSVWDQIRKGVWNSFGIAVIIYIVCAQFYPIFLNHTELSSFFFLYAGLALYSNRIRKYD